MSSLSRTPETDQTNKWSSAEGAAQTGGTPDARDRASGQLVTIGPGERWSILWGAIGAVVVGLLVAGVFSSSEGMFAWAIVGFDLTMALLVIAQLPRWQASGSFEKVELLPTLVLALCGESAAVSALLVIGALIRSPVPLVVSAIGLLLSVAVCDIAVALRVRRVASAGEQHDHASDEPALPQPQGLYGAGRKRDGQTPAIAQRAASGQRESSSGSRAPTVRVLAHARTLAAAHGIRLSQSIAPIALTGAMSIGVATYAGHLSTPNAAPASSVARSGTARTQERHAFEKTEAGSEHNAQRAEGRASNPATPPATRKGPWNGPCGTPPKSSVSFKAATRMLRLFDVESHLEPSVEGCVGAMEPHRYPGDFYVTATGIEAPSGETLAFAVYSERYGGLIVLKSAQAELEALIELVGPVGGVGRYPRYLASSGDYYLLRTPLGMYVLIRETAEQGYELLPPGLAKAWYLLMVTLETWLWPSRPIPGPHGGSIYQMWAPRNAERPAAEVVFDPATGAATCGKIVYRPEPRFELSLTVLVERAADA
jgi:hypothetical protein